MNHYPTEPPFFDLEDPSIESYGETRDGYVYCVTKLPLGKRCVVIFDGVNYGMFMHKRIIVNKPELVDQVLANR